MTRTFSISSAKDQIDRLRKKMAAHKVDDLDEVLAIELACVAWNMCDWTFRDYGISLGYATLGSLQSDMKAACSELAYLQDICNEGKHAKITRYTPQIDRAERHSGAFSRGFSRDFDTSCLQIVVTNGPTLWFTDVADAAVSHWEKFYRQHGL